MTREARPMVRHASSAQPTSTIRSGLRVALACTALATSAGAQMCAVTWEGQWAGPYAFNRVIDPDGSEVAPNFQEIAHGVLLPPPNDGWVLLWCARNCNDLDVPLSEEYVTFLWSASNPSSLRRLPMPAVPGSPPPGPGSADLFCGGQFLNEHGLVVTVGGNNVDTGCIGHPVPGSPQDGHKRVWVLDTTQAIALPPATPLTWHLNLNDMLVARWYGNGVQLADGRSLVDGHGGTGGGSLATARIREYGRILVLAAPFTLTWDAPPPNQGIYRNWRKAVPTHAECEKVDDQGTGDVIAAGYSHVHQLIDGRVLHFMSRDVEYAPPEYVPFFLDFQACLTQDPGEPERWVAGDGTSPAPAQDGAPSVHVIDDSGSVTEEIVYSFGGSTTEDQCGDDATDAVTLIRFFANLPGTLPQWELGPTLLEPRNAANAAVGLDGSVYVFGGDLLDDSQNPAVCIAQKVPERLRPSLIFSTGTLDVWEPMCTQNRKRSYHSIALLLPDGRFISAGGQEPEQSHHSLEIFSPPYLFQVEPRPEILTMGGSATAIPEREPASTLALEVDLPGNSGGEFRVALVQPSAVTHSTNTGGRYVRLRHEAFTPMGYGATTTIFVTLPATNNIIPPGYYMLTVVSSDGVPSIAKWIKVKRQFS